MRRAPGVAAIVAAVIAVPLARCGYRPVRALPKAFAAIHLAPVEASRTPEPELAPALRLALSRELARRGVRVVAGRQRQPVLETTMRRLDAPEVALSGHRLAAVELALELDLHLHRDGETLWRSGLIRVREIWSMADDVLDAEQTRLIALRRLARRAAAIAVERLESRR